MKIKEFPNGEEIEMYIGKACSERNCYIIIFLFQSIPQMVGCLTFITIGLLGAPVLLMLMREKPTESR